MNAGRDLDALIAERVMRLEQVEATEDGMSEETLLPITDFTYLHSDGYLRGVPKYSTDIAAAWEVVNEMDRRKFVLRLEAAAYDGNSWTALFGFKSVDDDDFIYRANSSRTETAPLAICNAALMALSEYRD